MGQGGTLCTRKMTPYAHGLLALVQGSTASFHPSTPSGWSPSQGTGLCFPMRTALQGEVSAGAGASGAQGHSACEIHVGRALLITSAAPLRTHCQCSQAAVEHHASPTCTSKRCASAHSMPLCSAACAGDGSWRRLLGPLATAQQHQLAQPKPHLSLTKRRHRRGHATHGYFPPGGCEMPCCGS